MAVSNIKLINRALARAGANSISSLEDGSAEGVFMASEYEQFAEEKLGTYRWRFCQELKELGAPTTDTPADRWAYSFGLPSDLLILHAVTRNGCNVDYERFGDFIFTDASDGLVAEYSFRADEALWPPYFREPFVEELASVAVRSLARNDSEADRMEEKAMRVLWPKARNLDSQQQPNKRLKATAFQNVRHGRN